jgi:hypothetical protein
VADAKWAIFLYQTLRVRYDNFHQELITWADAITDGPDGAALPTTPVVPAFPTLPTPAVLQGIEARRASWVARVKEMPGYSQSIGEALQIVAPVTPFDPASYVPVLSALRSQSAKTVTGRFRKAYGNVDGIVLFGRKEGSTSWIELGRFNAMPFSAEVPVTGPNPEVWEFAAQAFKKDVPFGNLSDIHQVTIKP